MNKQNIAIGGAVIAAILSIVALVGNQPATIKGEKGDRGDKGEAIELGSRGSRFPGDYCLGTGFRFVCRGATALEYRRASGSTASNTAAVAQDSFQNTSGHDIWVRYSFIFDGEASSTVFHEVGTTTAATVEGYTALVTKNVLPTTEISTGTPSFAFSSWFANSASTTSSNAGVGHGTTSLMHKVKQLYLDHSSARELQGENWTRVKHGEYVTGLFRGISNNCLLVISTDQDTNCENATSSARNWDAYGTLEYMYIASSSDQK